jgi:hypothetical protein
LKVFWWRWVFDPHDGAKQEQIGLQGHQGECAASN